MRRWPALYAGASLLFALGISAGYLWDSAHAGLAAALQLSVVAAIAAGAGRVLLRGAGLADISDSQKTLIGATLGLGVLSLGIFALAALHALYFWSAAAMLGVLWVVGFTEIRAIVFSLGSNRSLLGERRLEAGLLGLLLGLVFWMTWSPPHQYDSLVYHLALAQGYVRAHGLTASDYLLFSHFPQNAEMLFTLALLLKSDLLAQMFSWLALTLSAWWIFEMGKREAPLSAVLLSCLLLCTHTAVMLLASITYAESLVMLWITAAVLSFLRWRQVAAAGPGPRSWLALSAVFAGLALGTKYYAGIAAGLLGAFLAARLAAGPSRERRARAWDLALFTGIVTALFAPWMAKNLLAVGNPVFPFLYRWFPMTGTGWEAENARGYFQVLTEYGHARSFWKDLASLPLLLLTNSMRFGRGMDVLGDMGWDLTFWLVPAAVWAGWRNKFFRGLMIFCAGYLAVWFCTGVVFRFLTVLVPLLCLLAGRGLYGLWEALGRRGRLALGSAAAALTATHLFLFLFVHGVFEEHKVLLGLESRTEFLSRRLDYYPCALYAREHPGKNDKILIVGEQRGYYVEQDHAAATIHAPNRYVLWANEAKSPRALAGRLRGEGFGRILLAPREAQRLSAITAQFTEAGLKNWAGLEAELGFEFKGPACALYAVGGEGP